MDSSRSRASSGQQERGSRSSRNTRAESSTNSATSRSSKSSRPADGNYEQKLIDGGIFPDGYEYPDGRDVTLPSGWDDLNQRLAQPRASLSPSRFPQQEYRDFVRAQRKARKEAEVKKTVLPLMMQLMRTPDTAVPEQLFSNIEPMMDGIARPTPDYYYGAPQELIHQKVRDDLGRHILPSGNSPAVPNFSMEVKGPTGMSLEGMRQACHYGAVGARAMHSLQSYGQPESAYNNQVSTISSLFQGGQLMMYGHSVAQPHGPGTLPEYHMHQISGWAMTGNQDSFLKGATAFKNAKDLTAEWRNAAIAQANASALQMSERSNMSTRTVDDSAPASLNMMGETIENSEEDEDEQGADEEEEEAEEEEHQRLPSRRASKKPRVSLRRQMHQARRSNASASGTKGQQRRS